MTLADVVHRIATDENFATQLRVEPQATLKASGLDLPAETLAALLKVLHQTADTAYARIEPSPTQSWLSFQFSPQWTPSFPSTNG